MAEKAYFFDSADGDRIYNASDFAKVFDGIVSDGVVPGKDKQLQVVLGEELQVIVKTGAAWVQGRYYRNDSSKALVVPEADSSHDRIDRVVLRLDLSINARKIETVIKQGVPAENPVVPELQQDLLIYEFPLYHYTVEANAIIPSNLIDEREFSMFYSIMNYKFDLFKKSFVGTLFTQTGLLTNTPGFILANGSELIRADYPLLWNFALNSNNIVTDEEWHSQKRYGSYSYGDGETTFRVPLLVDFVRGYDPASGKTMGQWVEDTFQGHYHKIIEPISPDNVAPTTDGYDYWDETNEYITLKDHGFKTGQAVADGINGEPRIGPETAPKHILLPKYIYTGEVW